MTYCFKCLHQWSTRVGDPKCCPRCKSFSWWIKIPGKCTICKRTFDKLAEHHVDGNRKNTTAENRLSLCLDCHSVIHSGIAGGRKSRRRTREYLNSPLILKNLLEYRHIWLKVKGKRC